VATLSTVQRDPIRPKGWYNSAVKFFADEMLGKLARWLRMSGLDVLYYRNTDDDVMIETARRENRVVLTRDTRLIKKLIEKEYLFISHDYLDDQIQAFYFRFPQLLKEQNMLSRCVECNTALRNIEKEKIKDKVWPYVYQTQDNFTTCPNCHRIYWKATHVKKIEERLNRMLSQVS